MRYDPRDLSSVVIVVDDKRVGRALPQPIGRVAEATTTTPPPPAGPKTDYLALVRADYDKRLVEEARPVAYADLGALDPGFDESRFLTVVADLTCARVRGSEADEVHAFWTASGPLPETLVRLRLRLDASGARGQAVFDDGAIAALFDVGAGVPRRLNRAASSAMIVAASRKKNTVAAQDVHDARVDRGRA